MSSLKVSLARLGLVTLTAGALASPALADFSPLGQPLEGDEGDFFVSAEVGGLGFGDPANANESFGDKFKKADKALLFGSNLFQDGSLVSGIFGKLNLAKQFNASPVGLGGYLAYQDVAEDGTGLKLGATIAYEVKVGTLTLDEKEASAAATAAKKTLTAATEASVEPAKTAKEEADENLRIAREGGAIAAQLFESYALHIGEVQGNPVLLTQTASLKASKSVGKIGADSKPVESKDVALGFKGGVALSTQFDKFSPSLSVEIGKASLKNSKKGMILQKQKRIFQSVLKQAFKQQTMLR
ncbi:MAG: hypothetical protein IPK86_01170 [Neisseriales bacterium]|nr:MAG: hypothetical protein IPK86_01170 [Neisseriales bacterium]